MKLRFIGTGSMENTTCNASIMIDDILFDIGNGVVYQLDRLNINLDKINYLVITHFHGDHFLDLTSLLIGRKTRNINNKFTIIGPVGLREKVKDLFAFAFGDGEKDGNDIAEKYNIAFVELEAGEEYVINKKFLKAYKLAHGINKEVLGYTYDNKIVYLTDTTLCESFHKLCNNIPYILADVTNLKTSSKHIGLEDYIKIAKENTNSKFYAIHRNAYDTSNVKEVIFPNDGDELIIE